MAMQSLAFTGYVGNIATRKVGDNSTVCNFSVATKEYVKGEEYTIWYEVTAWNQYAELCGKFLKKGAYCGVVAADFVPGIYHTSEGEARLSLKVTAAKVDFGPKQGEQEEGK